MLCICDTDGEQSHYCSTIDTFSLFFQTNFENAKRKRKSMESIERSHYCSTIDAYFFFIFFLNLIFISITWHWYQKKKKKKKNAFIVPLEFSFCSVTTSWTCHRCYGYGSSRWTFADWPSSLSLCVNNFFPSICVDHLCWSLSREIWRSFPPPPTICSNFDVDRRLGLILMNIN